jgi:hypothetical protein
MSRKQFEPNWAARKEFECELSKIIYKVACAECVLQCKLRLVQIPASARKLAMKTMHAKNCNSLELHSISQISSSNGLERQNNEITSLKASCAHVCSE